MRGDGLKIERSGEARTIPILCFHAIEDGPGPLCIPPALFERQVKHLKETGWQTMTVGGVATCISSGRAFPDRTLAFTFDDGFASVHGTALEILDSVGFTASIYPVTSYLGGVSKWDGDVERLRLRLLSPAQLRELHAAGWEVGGHTHTHPQLPRLGLAAITAEFSQSTAVLEDLTGESIRTFAYPYGLHDAASRAAAGAAYEACLAGGAAKANIGSSLDCVERVEAWYLRRTWQISHLHDRLGSAYLALRRVGRAIRGRRPGPSTVIASPLDRA